MATLHFSSSSSSALLQNPNNFCTSHILFATTSTIIHPKPFPIISKNHTREASRSRKWRIGVSFFPPFLTKTKDVESLKQELLEAISPLDRGAAATPDDQQRIEDVGPGLGFKASEIDYQNLHGFSFETERPKFVRPNGRIYQAINVDTLRAQNIETWPFFNQATANLVPLNARRVAVKFDSFKIAALIPIKSRGSGRGQLEITYLDDELRISRGNQGNLFVLRMVDPQYRVPL
ncbi:hypothetical protein RD792_001974 [Penstemon davidsonii]|uniref:Plastid lipid-associated protein/fibrillin conserved domain-containing protein n=1 Tax=Penstemon davidsonii TaxID=160366 RepID=A0ABR0DPT3_9LAMI|nr:hypothetical protein RD792_001974 [Penstemon davidsonii]